MVGKWGREQSRRKDFLEVAIDIRGLSGSVSRVEGGVGGETQIEMPKESGDQLRGLEMERGVTR